MNRILDRNKETLSPREREELWRRIASRLGDGAGGRVGDRVGDGSAKRPRKTWSVRVPIYAGGLAVAVLAVLLFRAGGKVEEHAAVQVRVERSAPAAESAPAPAGGRSEPAKPAPEAVGSGPAATELAVSELRSEPAEHEVIPRETRLAARANEAPRSTPAAQMNGVPAPAPAPNSISAEAPSKALPPSIAGAREDSRVLDEGPAGVGHDTEVSTGLRAGRVELKAGAGEAPAPRYREGKGEGAPPDADAELARSMKQEETGGPAAADGEVERVASASSAERSSPAAGSSGAAITESRPGPAESRSTPVSVRGDEAGGRAGGAAAGRRGAGAGSGTIRGTVRDLQGKPLAYANVIVVGTQWGAFSQEDGVFKIPFVPVGIYAVRVNLIGYEDQTVDNVRVEKGQTTTVDFTIKDKPLGTMPEVEVVARREVIKQKEVKIGHDLSGSVSAKSGLQQVWGGLKDLVAGAPKMRAEEHLRGGRGNEMSSMVRAPASRPPVDYYTGGNALPNDEPYDAMFFQHYGVNPFIPADEDALSTFAVDVDNASYTVMRRYVELGNLPPKDAVRVEEFVNYFPQGYPRFETPDFRIMIDGAPSPFGAGYHLLRVGIRGRVIDERDRKPATLVFVIDVSGSMAREDRLELVKRALGLLVDRLRPGDEVGIVVYGSEGRVLLDPVRIGEDDFAEDPDWRDDREREGRRRDGARWNDEGDDEDVRFRPANVRPPRRSDARERILATIESLHPEGSTNAEEGIRLGYEMARGQYRRGAVNRILLCSDGVANVGLTGPESILKQVRDEADRGITLTTIGFGMGNYNDVLMEQLADRGDGSYYYVDDLGEARRVFVENLTGTLQTIARDAKVQVEFDPKRVLRYRLLGFENRDVADRDFRNDKVDAGEIGAGHEVTALYEVKLAEGAERGTLATVRFRYARPERDLGEGPRVREIEERFDAASLHDRFRDAAPEFRLDAAVAEFAEILRGSYWAKESRVGDVEPIARAAAEDLGTEEAREFARIVRKAEGLPVTVEPEGEE